MNQEPGAFLSYVQTDDHDGRITAFREQLSNEIRMQLGRPFPIFQDRKDIHWGQNWQSRIEKALNEVTFLIPIITPSFFRSVACRHEVELFLLREEHLQRRDLILPILYVETLELTDKVVRQNDQVVRAIADHQYNDWSKLRLKETNSVVVKERVAELAFQVRSTLDQFLRQSYLSELLKKAVPQSTELHSRINDMSNHERTSLSKRLRTRWEGVWDGSDGDRFSFVMHMDITPDNQVSGHIVWRLLYVPPSSHLSNLINDSGNEFVRGTIDRLAGEVSIEGYQVDEPGFLAMDRYRLYLHQDECGVVRTFTGVSLGEDNNWSSRLHGILSLEQENMEA